jgi:ATP-dependent DNA helicase RecG
MDIQEILKRPEGKTLEFKRDLSSPERILRSIVAFANTAGGILLVGVEDATRNVRGVHDILAEENKLANLVSDCIRPLLVPDLELLPWRQKDLLAARIYPGANRPYYVRKEGMDQGVYVRVGSTNRRADRAMIREIERSARNLSFDEEPVPTLSSEALDFRAASELFADRHKFSAKDMETLGLVTVCHGRKVPTHGGIILFGLSRQKHFPDAWIQVGRFAGIDKARILDSQDICVYPSQAVEKAFEFVQKHDMRRMAIHKVRRIDRWMFPPEAVREAIVNAVVHADYSQRGAPIRVSIYNDRLEVESPGLLPFGLTVEDIQQGVSKLRNRVISRVFREAGLVEQWGSGVHRMNQACREAGVSLPVFEEIAARFRVTIRNARIKTPQTDARSSGILDLLKSRGPLSTKDIAEHITLTRRATWSQLQTLVKRGLVMEIGTGPRDPKRKYAVAAQ